MATTAQTPFYKKLAYVLISIFALGYLYVIGRNIISPLLIAILFAILLRPVVAFLQNRLRFPNALAALISVLLFFTLFIGILYFITTQITHMADDWDKIKQNVAVHYRHIQDYLDTTLNIEKAKQDQFVREATHNPGGGTEWLENTLLSFTDVLIGLITLPVYMFLLLLYRTHFAQFLCRLVDSKYHEMVKDIIATVKVSVQGYILGLFSEMVIVSILTSIGYWIIGLKYAILLGVLTGLLNLIPYLGILTAGLLAIVASLTTTTELSIVVGVIVVNLIVQFLDNNILVPLVVSSKVEINPLATIIGIITGGALGGIPGMFLAIPVMAILKVIFDRVESLSPWGYLLGDDIPKAFRWRNRIRKIVKK